MAKLQVLNELNAKVHRAPGVIREGSGDSTRNRLCVVSARVCVCVYERETEAGSSAGVLIFSQTAPVASQEFICSGSERGRTFA